MPLFFRFAIPLFLVLGLVGFALTPVVNHLMERWFLHDVEIRSRLIFNTLQDTAHERIKASDRAGLETLFRRISEDERVLGVGLCVNHELFATGGSWPAALSCSAGELTPPRDQAPRFRSFQLAGGAVLLASFPLKTVGDGAGMLLVLHDLRFIDRRGVDTQIYLGAALTLFALISALFTLLVARLTLRRWMSSLRGMIRAPADDASAERVSPEIGGIASEIRQLLRDLELSRTTADGVRIDWSPDTLRRILETDLADAELIVVSNREPYIHNQGADGQITLQRPASGVVTALEPITRACAGTWIAHGSGSADRLTVDAEDRLAVPPDAPAYTLRRVWLTDEEENGYYYGLANEGLWPLCHVSFVRPIFREADWAQYVAVNRKFAEAVVAEAKSKSPIVLIQDYHFALLPRMIRDRLPNAIVITFWHIPWPNPEILSIFPWREALIEGLLGSSIIGFHTRFHCNNFIDTVDRLVESHIDREHATISVGGLPTLVRSYPISIEWPPAVMAEQASVAECRRLVRQRHGLSQDSLFAVGVERMDFTKGIPDRFAAVEVFLDQHPEFIGRFTYLQIAAPSRGKLPAYRAIQEETTALAKAINARFAGAGQPPIILINEHHEQAAIMELFRAADVCIVSSLHDGMNLVAKEFVSARDDEEGVLILSTFAGASRELLEALIVNPYDVGGMAAALNAALGMSREEQRQRMALLRGMVRENNVFRWAGRMLLDAARLRKRNRITSLISETMPGGANK